MKSFTFDLYYRIDEQHEDSVVKVAVHNGEHWLDKHEMHYAYAQNAPAPVGSMFRVTTDALSAYGIPSNGVDLTLSGKQCFLKSAKPPLDLLGRFGWNLKPYPRKFITVEDTDALRSKVALSGLSLDVANIVAQERFADTEGRVIKGIVDTLDDLGIRKFLYIDHKMWGWLLEKEWQDAYDYLMGFYRVPKAYRRITTSKKGVTADEIMLRQADIRGNHILSRDEFDEFDLQYDWVMHGAESGYPRLHKFVRVGDAVFIPDIGVTAEIPSHW